MTVSSPAFSQSTFRQQTVPLIKEGGEFAVYVGTFLIIVIAIAIVEIVSRRTEHTVFTALGLSLILIFLFFLLTK